jgi:hypothetical protein
MAIPALRQVKAWSVNEPEPQMKAGLSLVSASR